jgi:hypothetical protein
MELATIILGKIKGGFENCRHWQSLVKLQRFLPHDHQKTTEIYAGHIETGTKKQTDFLADFWTDKLDLNEGQESIPASDNQVN